MYFITRVKILWHLPIRHRPTLSSASPVLNRVLTSFGEVNLKHEQTNRLESENYAGELAFLRQQNKQLQHVIDVMPTGMIMLNGNGIVVKINDTARAVA